MIVAFGSGSYTLFLVALRHEFLQNFVMVAVVVKVTECVCY